MNLNFGHRFAHAIEMALDKHSKDFIRHGEAVGLEFYVRSFYANKKKNKIYREVEKLLEDFNLPIKLDLKKNSYNYSKTFSAVSEIYRNVFLDKKKLNKNPRFIYYEGKNILKK